MNQKLWKLWCDEEYLAEIFKEASKKNLLLFEKTKHGKYLTNYFVSLAVSKLDECIKMIYTEIITPIEISLITETEYMTSYTSNYTREFKLTVGRLLKSNDRTLSSLLQCDKLLLSMLQIYLRVRYGWILRNGNGGYLYRTNTSIDDIIYVSTDPYRY